MTTATLNGAKPVSAPPSPATPPLPPTVAEPAPGPAATDGGDSATPVGPPATVAEKPKRLAGLRQRARQRRDMVTELLATSDNVLAARATHVGLAATIAFNFLLSFVGLYSFTADTMRQPPILAACVPLAVDGASLAVIGLMYRQRNAKLRVRLYLWFAYLVAAAASVAANCGHVAAWTDNPWLIAAGGFPSFMMSVLVHGWLIADRHTDRAKWRHKRKATTPPPPAATLSAPTPPDEPTASANDGEELAPPMADTKAYARHRVAGGATVAKVLADLAATQWKTSERTIQRWTADLRQG